MHPTGNAVSIGAETSETARQGRQLPLERMSLLRAPRAIGDEGSSLSIVSSSTTTPNALVSARCAPQKIAGQGRDGRFIQ
jgi:hypothetical protein